MLDTSNVPVEELPKAICKEAMKSCTKYFNYLVNNLVNKIDHHKELVKMYENNIKKYILETLSYYNNVFHIMIDLIFVHKEKIKLYEELVLLLRHQLKDKSNG